VAELADDLALAAACARGEAAALAEFEARFGADIDRAIHKSPTLGIAADEFRQLIRERLFVASGDKPARIAGYQGKGPLRSWVRVTCARLVVDIARRSGSEVPKSDDEIARRLPPAPDAELDHLRRAYGEMLPEVFASALAGLTPRQRNLLRQRYLHELTVERLAAMYQVHRSTVFEWLNQARADLQSHLRVALAARVPGPELDSVVALLGSELELSVRRMLASQLE
jgi:RNA polymerase sigma-70 factor (ECF subfamily)